MKGASIKGKSYNRLISEKSPYLLQHAHNPVDWNPWGTSALERAKKEDKPIFLSIGYSTCHWCHVMERESFEDPAIAELLNETFICIKVDREERPDIDRTYMRFCQMMTGSGGWPLTMFLLPDKRPFFAGTYIPRESRFGRIGMKELIPQVKALWLEKREELYNSAERNLSLLNRYKAELGLDRVGGLDEKTLDEAYVNLVDTYDELFGGFGRAPKFPSPHRLTFLLRYWKRTGHNRALRMVEKTLASMRLGGLYDHIGFGFHRYSTDRQWLTPHFEKMLYDQAMLTLAYTEAYQATRKEEFKETATSILTYVLRDMRDPTGGFYSAEDADVEGKEGEFYLWTEDEIRSLLPEMDAELVLRVFNIERNGNYIEESTQRKTGNNIFHLKQPLNKIADSNNVPFKNLQNRLETIREVLFSERESRTHPLKDDKILTDWNGLMIAALAKASRIFNDENFLVAAKKTVELIIEKLRDSKGMLYHRYRDGEAAIPAFLDDYAFLVWGFLELYETTFDVAYLRNAISFSEDMISHFWDAQRGGFYFTADNAENVLVRDKEIYDGAYPSGNSVAASNLIRLARITGDAEFEVKATTMLKTFSNSVSQNPAAHAHLLMALSFAIGPSYEVVIVGDPLKDDTKSMIAGLRTRFIPNKTVLFRPSSSRYPEITRYAEYTRELSSKEGRATAYVCSNYQCSFPVTHIEEMFQLLDETT